MIYLLSHSWFVLQVCEDKPVQKCETVTTPMEYEVAVEKCEGDEEKSRG